MKQRRPTIALPAGRYGLDWCEHNLKPRKNRVSKFGFLLGQWENHPPAK
ncbi:hypothetical protein [Levilactobacillus sp. N40-8-2]